MRIGLRSPKSLLLLVVPLLVTSACRKAEERQTQPPPVRTTTDVTTPVPAVTCEGALGSTEHDFYPADVGSPTPLDAVGTIPGLDPSDYKIHSQTKDVVILVHRNGDQVVSVATARRNGEAGWVITQDNTCE